MTCPDIKDVTNVTPLKAGIDFIKMLAPIEFDWKTGEQASGFLIQDLQWAQQQTNVVLPGLTYYEDQVLKGDDLKLIPALVQALSQQQDQLESLHYRLESLESQRNSLYTMIDSLAERLAVLEGN